MAQPVNPRRPTADYEEEDQYEDEEYDNAEEEEEQRRRDDEEEEEEEARRRKKQEEDQEDDDGIIHPIGMAYSHLTNCLRHKILTAMPDWRSEGLDRTARSPTLPRII